ncbi:phosphatase PAP2 family protein [Uruburuella testudinis]|uniref:Phosphatase PAP2 family protein n=1 Tax=Uruburuella testudinis TaxID=1282863 RepID=A0ABY4DUC7_9NEIS|nr:phosphatase PAP2 family protein [Uruburuella testudinis]UOO82463.1 phosphatase PAP2 family protein [Uruburuella testudinis]
MDFFAAMPAALTRYLPSFKRLAVLFFGIVLPLLLAGEIAEEILERERFAFEQPLMMWVHEHMGQAMMPVAVVLHHVGKTSVAATLAVLFAVYHYFRNHRSWAVFILLGAALPTAIMFVAKLFFNRARPELWPRIIEETNASFPSGHSTFAAALATVWVLVYWHTPHRGLLIAAAVLFAFFMGFSRIVLGVHYPTDVLVGWITGTSTVLGLHIVMYRRLPRQS